MRMKVQLFLNLFLKQQKRFLFVGQRIAHHRFYSNELYYKILEPVFDFQPQSKKLRTEPGVEIKSEPDLKIKSEPGLKIKSEPELVNVNREQIERIPRKDDIDSQLKKSTAKIRLLEYDLSVSCDFSFGKIKIFKLF